MLVHLSVSNFAITQALEIELQPGMTVLTGETGAGKSIMLDALGLTLGDRADSGIVRAGAERADIHAEFDISDIPLARILFLCHLSSLLHFAGRPSRPITSAPRG